MKKYPLISFALIALIGCGGDEPTLSEAETQQALTAVTTASTVGVNAATVEVNGQEGRVTVDAAASCLGGGTVGARGELEITATTASYSLDLTFDACSDGNVAVDGLLSYTGSASEQSVSLSISGEVTLSGAIQGTCAIDIEQSVNAATSSISMNGSACGNDVSFSFQGQ